MTHEFVMHDYVMYELGYNLQIIVLNHHIKWFTMTFLTRCVNKTIMGNNVCYMLRKIGINIAEHGDSFQSIIFPAAT